MLPTFVLFVQHLMSAHFGLLRQASRQVRVLRRISFCDLAGSERWGKTNSFGERLKEAGKINTSLMTLGKCLETLRYNQQHTKRTFLWHNQIFKQVLEQHCLQVDKCRKFAYFQMQGVLLNLGKRCLWISTQLKALGLLRAFEESADWALLS